MMKLLHIKSLMVIYFLFLGNETVETKFLQEKEASLVIYRKSNLNFSTGFHLYLNDSVVIKEIEPNTYYIIKTRPGKVLLKTQGNALRNFTEKKEYSLTLMPGQTYYLEAIQEYQVLMTTMHLVRRQEDSFKHATKKMKSKFLSVKVSDSDKKDF